VQFEGVVGSSGNTMLPTGDSGASATGLAPPHQMPQQVPDRRQAHPLAWLLSAGRAAKPGPRTLLRVGPCQVRGPHHGQLGPTRQRHVQVPAAGAAHLVVVQPRFPVWLP